MPSEVPLQPLQCLFEQDGLPSAELPPRIGVLYGGTFGLAEPCLYTNFVSTIDGVVAAPFVPRSNAVIAGGSDGDRFVMGLLRAFADCVLIGAGTLVASPKGTWLAESVFPGCAEDFAELRRARGRPPKPEIAIVTGHGSIDLGHPVLERAVVLTSDDGAERLEGRLPDATGLLVLGSSVRLDPRLVVGALRERGHRLILSEAGPHTFGGLLEAGVVDELFLTVSPLLAGSRGADDVYGLVESARLLPLGAQARLLSLRRHEQYLFVRYSIENER
jgi:riboflavin biosynthesis pyrimidine reductase